VSFVLISPLRSTNDAPHRRPTDRPTGGVATACFLHAFFYTLNAAPSPPQRMCAESGGGGGVGRCGFYADARTQAAF